MNTITKTESQPLLTVVEGQVKTTSLDVAEKFGKAHDKVLRAVRNLDCSEQFADANFGLGSYQDANNQPRPMYDITRDGFCFLVMGFTGKESARWKEAYITAFNQMETELKKMHRPKLDEAERRRLRDQKAKLVTLVATAKTVFERDQFMADLVEVSMILGQPLPDVRKIGLAITKTTTKGAANHD
ncbi:Rha family transcriptional regulator [Endozoicomonas sp. YOMI1]|uniref:Rha family transcriptional regulator n=1 Tax=Endozoicomonas sp. YOMI1 TaxID=2828739 RepID=UPI0021484DB7|nr:Rha family transcriptional regulator [Endozoicomonas sp. YOMI1]